jgi:hypothetical protein
VQRLVFALVNEGAHILEEGIASKASDIDMVYLTGYGFPIYRGGPMHYADQVGLFNVVQAMKRFARNPLTTRSSGSRRRCSSLRLVAFRRQDLQLSRRTAAMIKRRCARPAGAAWRWCWWPCWRVNTWRQGSRQLDVPPLRQVAVDDKARRPSAWARRCASQTISSRDRPGAQRRPVPRCTRCLQQRYPKAHATLKRELVGDLSLLYTWPGSDPKARPIALMAHQDVVPVAPGHRKQLAAAAVCRRHQGRLCLGPRRLGRQGQPDRADGGGGDAGGQRLPAARRRSIWRSAPTRKSAACAARRIAALLQERGVKLEFVIDEGLLITEGIMPGVRQAGGARRRRREGLPVGRVLKRAAPPGHSSMPPPRAQRDRHDERRAARLDDEQMPAASAAWPARCSPPWRPRWAASCASRCPTCGCSARWCRSSWKSRRQHERHAAHHHRADDRQGRQQGERAARPGRGDGQLPPAAGRHHRQRHRA